MIIARKQLCYRLREADDCGVTEHPLTQMRELGYKIIASVPQSIYDSWWFTVEEFIEPLPPYLTKMSYDFEYWHGNNVKAAPDIKNTIDIKNLRIQLEHDLCKRFHNNSIFS